MVCEGYPLAIPLGDGYPFLRYLDPSRDCSYCYSCTDIHNRIRLVREWLVSLGHNRKNRQSIVGRPGCNCSRRPALEVSGPAHASSRPLECRHWRKHSAGLSFCCSELCYVRADKYRAERLRAMGSRNSDSHTSQCVGFRRAYYASYKSTESAWNR
jgi:hypothetical protein